jgi:hypothetical protein
MAVPLPEELSGRRLYLHEVSLLSAARQVEEPAAIIRAMSLSWATRLAGHLLGDAAGIGAIDPAIAHVALAELHALWSEETTAVLQGLCAPAAAEAARCPLLAPDESVVAACFESGYYTYATTESAGERMFADHEPLGRLYAACAAGRGPADLTMARGQRGLAVVAPTTVDRPVVDAHAVEKAVREVLDAADRCLGPVRDNGELGSRVAHDVQKVLALSLDQHVVHRATSSTRA